VTRIFDNLWETKKSNWNFVTNKFGQIGADGKLKYN